MINTIKVIEQLSEKGINVDVKDNELKIKAEKGIITKDILEEIKNNKQNIISLLEKKQAPLSFAQKRLWFVDQYEHNANYNVIGAVKLIGKLDQTVLEKTFSEIIRRHEVLRTNFVTINNVPRQIIHIEPKIELQTIDQSHLPEEEANKKIQRLIEIESQKSFDLINDSLIRLVLYKINDEDHTLFLNKHHIITDGWSFSLFFKEISILYKAFSENKPSPLAELEIQYADYTVWQREQMQGDVLKKQSEYWNNKLSDLAILELPSDKTRPKDQTFNGANQHFSLDKDITEKLNIFSKENNVTLFMTLLSAFKVLLNKYTGQDDICVGSPIANRTRSEIEPLLGFFVNTLALRSDLSGDISFIDLLKQVRQTTLDAYANQDIPFEKVVDIVKQERNLSYSSLFQVMMVLQNTPRGELSLGDLTLKPVTFESAISKFDLTLNFAETEEGLICGIEYNTDLFDKDRIERMTRHFNALVESIISNPTTTISELEILTSEEKHKLLVEWNDTKVDYSKDKCIHQLFEYQVEKTPDNIAVVFEKERLTYHQLNERANKLGHYLQGKGVKEESLVGICVNRSLEMIVGILGILKAGGAYVPIDPNLPENRISYVLADADCAIVLTQEHLKLPKTNSEVILLDADWDKIENEPVENVKSEVENDNLAYVIYTLGSTGQPIGVMNQHNGIVNRIFWTQDNFKLQEDDVVLQKTTYNFDVSVWELFWPIVVGCKLVFVKPEGHKDNVYLIETIIKEKISTIHFVPSMLHIILDTEGIEKCTSLKRVLSSGETLSYKLTEQFYKKMDNCSLHNLYGPTEAAVNVTYFPCKEYRKYITVPIGKPVANTELLILDKNNKLVPIGVSGELHIGGEQIARGYLKKPELTAEKFIRNPFSDDPDSRLYKTGDLVKYLSDGNIELIERIDDHVKIRGFRIELGELQVFINKIKTINDCVVAAKEDINGNKQLVAYLVSDDEINLQEIREILSKSLPDYMVPSLFMRLEKIPLTSTGKIDRKALPEPEGNIETTNEYVAPQTETEQKLAEIWQEALGVDKVSINDNFFELEGHSLLAVQIFSKIKSVFDSELPLKTLFETPTIKQLSLKIDNTNTAIISLPEIIHDEENKNKPFPLTDVQQAYWMGRSDMYTLGNIGTHAYAEIYLDELDIEKFNYAINYMIDRHDMLRMVITEDGQQKILEDIDPYQISVLDLRNKSNQDGEEEFYKLRNELSHQVFDGFTWPLFDIRVSIFKDDTYKIHLSMDALLFDASSGTIFTEELILIYKSETEKLPSLDVTFRDYVMAEQSIRDTALYKNAQNYWLNRIANFPEKPELPLAMSPQEIKSPKFDRRELFLDSTKWKNLQNNIKKAGVTPTVFFIECFGQIIEKWSKNNHFLLNLTLFNRIPFHEDVNKIIGDFTSLTILEMDYRENKNLIHRLKDTQAQLWDDIEHKYYSGVEVQRELSRSRGEIVTFPVVVTSLIGLADDTDDEDNETSTQDRKVIELDEIQKNYSITQTSQVWLDYKISIYNGGISIEWDFVDGLFPVGMLDVMFTAFESLLNDLATKKTLWEDANIVSIPSEQLKLQQEINATSSPVSAKLMHELFVDQVKKNKDKIAVKSNSKVLSYGQLYSISKSIGVKLKELNAKPNHLIAILMQKGWEQVPAALGIQFSGAAYLPIDASLPRERIIRLLEIGQVEIVVSVSSVLDKLELPDHLKTLTVNEIKYEDTLEIEEAYYQESKDLAYVIFTSGSTGEPKGVVIDHRGAVNTILDINNRFDITEKDRCFAISSLSFDLSVYDVFGMLAAGGTVVIPDPSEQKDPSAWARYISDEEITIWNSVPALMQMLAEYASERSISFPLRKILLSGDWIPVSLPDKIKELSPGAEVISLGGATEASIWSIYYPIQEVHPDWKSIPYGKPLTNQSFHVLKPDLTDCPHLVTGDLYIGGIGLALGYWQDEKKTASSFITHPETGVRLYKTGDMGRYLPDGNIEFLGREDAQVKVQGYRIELGEIEHALEGHEQVEKAVVDVREIRNAKKIAAYLVLSQNGEDRDSVSVLEEKLRGYLGDKLPDYMVPSHYNIIEKVPVTANGKVNRKALPNPQLKDNEKSVGYVAPSNEVEGKLVKILQETLGTEGIGINDNFFELGLNSIQIVGLNSTLKKELNVEIEIVDLFVFTTIKKLSNHIKGKELAEEDNRNDEIITGKKNYQKLLKRRI